MATYTVRPGDTLSAVAQRAGTTVDALARANRLADPNALHVGQTLTMPGDSYAGAARASAPQAAPAPRGIAARLRAPIDWFISQYRGRFNPNEDARGNLNCGPTALAMIAKAFGKVHAPAAAADGLIERVRRLMGAPASEYTGTSFGGMQQAARALGLQSQHLGNASMATLQAELAKGRLVVANVHTGYLGADTLHFTVVTRIENGRVHLNDPAAAAPITLSAQAFRAALGGRSAVSFWG